MRILIILLAFLLACALPKDNEASGSKLSDSELQAVLYVRSGIEYYLKSRYVDAEFAFRKALVIYPDADNVKANLAAALLAQGQTPEALSIYQKLRESNPNQAEYLQGIAEISVLRNENEFAVASFENVYELYIVQSDFAKAANILTRLAEIQIKLSNYKSAICYLKKAIELNPDPESRALYYRLALQEGMLTEPDLINPGRELKSLDVQELIALGFVKYQERDYQKVVEIIDILNNRKLKQAQEFELNFIRDLAKLNLGETEIVLNYPSMQQLDLMPAQVSEDLIQLARKGLLQIPAQYHFQDPV